MDDAQALDQKQSLPDRLQFVRVVAWLMVAVTAVGLFGITDLMTLPGWVDQRYVWAVSLEASWGSLMTFIVAGSYASIALNPRDPWPGTVLLVVAGTALVLGTIFGADSRPLPLALIVAVPAIGLVYSARKEIAPPGRSLRPGWLHLLMGASGVPLWLPYSMHALQMSRVEPNAGHDTWGIEHWPVQGAAGITIMVAALIMGWWGRVRSLARVSISLSAAFIGVAMLAYPDRAGAMEGSMWGVAMVLWATVLALLPANGTTATPPRQSAR
jgi:hypothetical protein